MIDTLGARDFSSSVSGFGQVFTVTRAKSFQSDWRKCNPIKKLKGQRGRLKALLRARGFSRGFGLRLKMCRPSANTENFRRMREKPLVPRVNDRRIFRGFNFSIPGFFVVRSFGKYYLLYLAVTKIFLGYSKLSENLLRCPQHTFHNIP